MCMGMQEDSKKRKAEGEAPSSPQGPVGALGGKRRSPDPPEGLLIPLAATPQQPTAPLPSLPLSLPQESSRSAERAGAAGPAEACGAACSVQGGAATGSARR